MYVLRGPPRARDAVSPMLKRSLPSYSCPHVQLSTLAVEVGLMLNHAIFSTVRGRVEPHEMSILIHQGIVEVAILDRDSGQIQRVHTACLYIKFTRSSSTIQNNIP